MAKLKKRPTQEELDFAQEMYLTATPEGRHKYSFAEIATQIENKWKNRYGISTIAGWVKRHGWDSQFAQGVRLGTLQGLVMDSQEDVSRAEQLESALAQGMRYVCTLQVEVAEKANAYLRALDRKDRGVPRAAEAATRANQALMDMLTAADMGKDGEYLIVVESIDDTEQTESDVYGEGASGFDGPEGDAPTALAISA